MKDSPSFYPAEIQLNKQVIAGTVINYFHSPGFPECIYISLENSLACGIGTVVNTLADMESTLEFTPLANINDLVLNIPSEKDFRQYFQANYGIINAGEITPELKQSFWDQYPFAFASSVGGTKINWE